jgi:hypothetical protein
MSVLTRISSVNFESYDRKYRFNMLWRGVQLYQLVLNTGVFLVVVNFEAYINNELNKKQIVQKIYLNILFWVN